MAMIKTEQLSFSYPSSPKPVFEDVNIQIDTDWRLGVIGRNGKGKTTLLKLLLNEYPYSGRIMNSTVFDYFPFPINDEKQMTIDILTELNPHSEEWEILREFSYLDLSSELLWRPFDTLSGGEKTKAMLAALFLKNNDFLLIDEPTNHLDRKAREKVAAYLKHKKGFLLVSHDRNFLDACVDHILSFNRSNIEIQNGNFSSWMINFQNRQEAETAQNERLKKEIKQLTQSARRTASWSNRLEASKFGNGPVDRGFIGHKSAKMMKRAKTMEAHKEKIISQKSKLLHDVETVDSLWLRPLSHPSNTLITLNEFQIVYDEKAIHQPLSFQINQGDRIALDGVNGCGKSSIMKLLSSEAIHYKGKLSIGNHLKISYVGQDCSFLNGSLSDFAAYSHIDESLLKAILRKMDFERIQFTQDMKYYSDGQKKKVMIAKSLCEAAHLYIWDEPLNFIDIYTRMQVEALLKDSKLTLLFVEHDHYFQKAVANKTIEMIKI